LTRVFFELFRLAEAPGREGNADPGTARRISVAALRAVCRPPAKTAALAVLRMLLEDTAIRIAAANTAFDIPDAPSWARLRTKLSMSVMPTTAASE
jgi:hypothetical protein